MRSVFSLVFFLCHGTFAIAQPNKYSDSTYHISKHGRALVLPTRNADTGKGVTIQNSLPKGARYVSPRGETFGYAIFWSRVINRTASQMELTIHFSADSFQIFPAYYSKVFLPPDKMTFDKAPLYDYGATGLKAFLDTGIHEPTILQCTISPHDDCLFYIVIITSIPDSAPPQPGFVLRPGLFLKEQKLYYRVGTARQSDLAVIPCGQIVFKEE